MKQWHVRTEAITLVFLNMWSSDHCQSSHSSTHYITVTLTQTEEILSCNYSRFFLLFLLPFSDLCVLNRVTFYSLPFVALLGKTTQNFATCISVSNSGRATEQKCVMAKGTTMEPVCSKHTWTNVWHMNCLSLA
jgi:hypothetical protein